MRGWSEVEPGIHLAFYEFENLVSVNKLLNSNLMREFIKEFDRCWAGKILRTREVFEGKQGLKNRVMR